MQSDVAVVGNTITGTVKKLDSYPPFDITLADHFIALHAETVAQGATIEALITPTLGMGRVTLDSDGIIVGQITPDTKYITFYGTKDGKTYEASYWFDLTFEE